VPLASARSGQRERVFMITGIGVHDRTDRPFKITGMRSERIILRAPGTLAIRPNMVIHRLMKGVVMAADGKRSAKAMGARLAVLYARFRPYCRPS